MDKLKELLYLALVDAMVREHGQDIVYQPGKLTKGHARMPVLAVGAHGCYTAVDLNPLAICDRMAQRLTLAGVRVVEEDEEDEEEDEGPGTVN